MSYIRTAPAASAKPSVIAEITAAGPFPWADDPREFPVGRGGQWGV